MLAARQVQGDDNETPTKRSKATVIYADDAFMLPKGDAPIDQHMEQSSEEESGSDNSADEELELDYIEQIMMHTQQQRMHGSSSSSAIDANHGGLQEMAIDTDIFRDLPIEVQQEMLHEYRMRSRQNFGKIHQMTTLANDGKDYSSFQIGNLVRRNAMWKQLQEMHAVNSVAKPGDAGYDDTIGKERVTGQVAAEVDRQYMLVKNNDGATWSLQQSKQQDDNLESGNPEIVLREFGKNDDAYMSESEDMHEKVEKEVLHHTEDIVNEHRNKICLEWLDMLPSDCSSELRDFVSHVAALLSPADLRLKLSALENDLRSDIANVSETVLCKNLVEELLETVREDAAEGFSSDSDDELVEVVPGALDEVIEVVTSNVADIACRDYSPEEVATPTVVEANNNVTVDEECGEDISQDESIDSEVVDPLPLSLSSKNEAILITVEANVEDTVDEPDNAEEVSESTLLDQANIAELVELRVEKPIPVATNEKVDEFDHLLDDDDMFDQINTHYEIPDDTLPKDELIQAYQQGNMQQLSEDMKAQMNQLANDRNRAVRDSVTVAQDHIHEIKVRNWKDSNNHQTLLTIFGIPYIVAPMEAEAQCASLEVLGLSSGTVTDDSDVFLFGGTKVYRNLFSGDRDGQLFTNTELRDGMGLTRERLIQMAYLTGSDYTEGVHGIGYVTAIEILSEWQEDGVEGLQNFRDWLASCLSDDIDVKDLNPLKRRLRKLATKVKVPDAFPDEHIWKEYMNPSVEDCADKFTWADPDIIQIRNFLRDRSGWAQNKTDEYVLPVIKQIGVNRIAATKKRVISDYFQRVNNSWTQNIINLKPRIKNAVNLLRGHVAEEPARKTKADTDSNADGASSPEPTPKQKTRKRKPKTLLKLSERPKRARKAKK